MMVLMKILDFNTIKKMGIREKDVYDWCNEVWLLKEECVLPAKTKMWEGKSGRYITMPCIMPMLDIAGVKFISRNVDDANGIPARNSHIMIQQRSKLGLLTVEDGMWITNMRTAAIAVHSVIKYSREDAKTLGLMGLGLVAWTFMKIFGSLCSKNYTIKLLRYKDQAERFVERFKQEFPQFNYEMVDTYDDICSSDIVVSAVGYARNEFAKNEIFQQGCLVVPIQTSGFQNCDLCFDKVIVDDIEHVKSYKYYERFKEKISEVSKIEKNEMTGRDSSTQRIIAYCGGIALHDIFCGYKIYQMAVERGYGIDVDMEYPNRHLWI